MAVLNRNIFLKLTCLTSMPNLVVPASATLLRKNSKISMTRKKNLAQRDDLENYYFYIGFLVKPKSFQKINCVRSTVLLHPLIIEDCFN